jgi:glucose-1-phosphatase
MKKTIIFDLGNVLIFFSYPKMCQQVAECTGLAPLHVKSLLEKYNDPHERGDVDSQAIYEDFRSLSNKNFNLAPFKRAMADIFVPNDPVISIALDLKKKGHKLILLSNTCDAHFAFASEQFPFLKAFDGHVLSYEVGARKPEKRIYEKALEMAGCRKEDCFYTDDLLPYIEAARSMDIDAEQYTAPEKLLQHLNARNIL